MALTPGTRLGPYEILSALGAGGMGVVYRAKDTTLHRDVAIKVLPEAFANDAERMARFQGVTIGESVVRRIETSLESSVNVLGSPSVAVHDADARDS